MNCGTEWVWTGSEIGTDLKVKGPSRRSLKHFSGPSAAFDLGRCNQLPSLQVLILVDPAFCNWATSLIWTDPC